MQKEIYVGTLSIIHALNRLAPKDYSSEILYEKIV